MSKIDTLPPPLEMLSKISTPLKLLVTPVRNSEQSLTTCMYNTRFREGIRSLIHVYHICFFVYLGLQQVEIKRHKTKFWRHQDDKPPTYLATIEAIYYFLREYHDLFLRTTYHGQYDNMLFFFNFMYHKIKGLYDGGKKLKAYQQH